MARLMVSAGMLSAFALSTAARNRGLPSGSPPPVRAHTVISLMNFVQPFDFLASEAAFLCLILLHRLWPDIELPRCSVFRASRKSERSLSHARSPGNHISDRTAAPAPC